MKWIVGLLLAGLMQLSAADSDFDGVDNKTDRCANTPFGDLVDSVGCTTKTVFTDTAYDLIVGINYADTNYNTLEKADTLTTTFQADMYRGDLFAQILTSYFHSVETNTTDSGWNDTQMGVYIKSHPASNLTLQSGLGIILPTYDSGYGNEAVDIFGAINLQYDINEHYHLFGGLTYTMVNDTDIQDALQDGNTSSVSSTVQYRNTTAFTAGVGYATLHNGFVNIAYSQSDSIYVGVSPFKTLSLNSMLPLDDHWFVLGNYRYGLSESTSDHEIAVRLGYYF